jgi:hypothetical protein
MRRLLMTLADVEAIASTPPLGEDRAGNSRHYGRFRGTIARVIVARDDPAYVISVHARRRHP